MKPLIWKLFLLGLMFSMTPATFAQQSNEGYSALIKSLNQHMLSIANTDLYPGGRDVGLSVHTSGIIDRTIAQFMHLADLERLREIVKDNDAKDILEEQLKSLRFRMKHTCAASVNTMDFFAKATQNPLLKREFNDLGALFTTACKPFN